VTFAEGLGRGFCRNTGLFGRNIVLFCWTEIKGYFAGFWAEI